METIKTVQDFKKFLNANRDKLIEKSVKIEDIPKDDEWFNDSAWDEIYEKKVARNGNL